MRSNTSTENGSLYKDDLYQDAVHHGCMYPLGIPNDSSVRIETTPPVPGQSSTDALLQKLLDVLGGGIVRGAYRSIKITIPASEQRYEIQLGMYATQLSIRCDQAVTLVFNNPGFDNLYLDLADFPLSISDLRLNESIHTIYVTTGAVSTIFQIFAFGSVK
jgi:hypothetical protein